MKRYLSLFLIPFLFGGCTLTLEEIPDPEPGTGPGYDEVATERTEFGTMEYQFKDSVLYVNQDIFNKNLVKVETDSVLNYNNVVLYFNTALPCGLAENMKVAAGAMLDTNENGEAYFESSRNLPYGLNHRITDVQLVNGMYRVEAVKVSTDEVYKHLKYCVDADIVAPDLNGMTQEQLADYGYQMVIDPVTGDTIIQDWNEVEIAKGIRPRAAKRKSMKRYLARTRGDKVIDDDIPEENHDDGIDKTTYVDIMLDTRNVENFVDGLEGASLLKKELYDQLKQHMYQVANKNKGKKVTASPYAAIGLQVVNYTQAHIEENKETGYELKYTDSWSEWTIKAELGFGAEYNSGYKGTDMSEIGLPKEAAYKNMIAAIKEGGMAGAKSMKTTISKKWDNAKIRIILTTSPVPIAFIASATVTPVVEVNGCISASLKCTTAKTRSGREIKKNSKGKEVETKIDQKLDDGSFDPQLSINGSMKIGAKFRAAAGIEVAGTVGVTIGANLETFFEAEMSFDIGEVIKNSGNEEFSAINAFDGSIKFYTWFYFDLQAFVAPLGIVELWSKQLWKSDPSYIMFFSTKATPTLYFNYGSPYFGTDLNEFINSYDIGQVDDGGGLIIAKYQLADVSGLSAWIKMRTYYPAMRLYFGDIKDNNWVWMARMTDDEGGGLELTSNKWSGVETSKTYRFWWMGNIDNLRKEGQDEIRQCYIVPVLTSIHTIVPGYAGPLKIEESSKYFGEMIVLDKSKTIVEVAKPCITTVGSGQIWGNTYEDTKANPHYSEGYISQTYGDVGAICSVDNIPKMRMYQFYHTVNVTSGSRMGSWGVKVYVFDTNGKTRLYRRKVPINQLRSGRYTFIFSFMTDWKQRGTGEKLYYRVQPYWEDPQLASGDEAFEADDDGSLKKWPLEYECVDEDDIEKAIRSEKGTTWGTVKDVNLNNNK